MKLIGSLASPYVRKVRVVLAEKKLDYVYERRGSLRAVPSQAVTVAMWPGP